MAIKAIEAKLECDGCGFIFHKDLDPADKDLKSYLDLATYVEHHIDVVGDHMLCPDCLYKVSIKLPEIDNPSYDQVHRLVCR